MTDVKSDLVAKFAKNARGEFVHVSIDDFKGKKLVNIRVWYTHETGTLMPGRQGITISVDKFEAFRSAITEVSHKLEKLHNDTGSG